MPRVPLKKPLAAAAAGGKGLYFSQPKENIQFIRSGCTLLDCVLGGGWRLGRVCNLVGDRSTGKTLLAMEAVANFYRQYPNGRGWYNETESAFDPDYARALGIPFDKLEFISDCETVEELALHVESLIKDEDDTPGLYIVDSLDALSDNAEKERSIEDGSYGAAKAKKLSEFFRKLNQDMAKSNICLLIISQVRDNIGAMFGNKHTRAGGKALDFYASQVVWLAHLKQLKRTVSKQERAVGIRVKAKNTKNKVGLPFRECEFNVTFGFGIEDELASREWLADVGMSAAAKEQDLAKLREHVVTKWAQIDEGFLPTRRKYE